MNDPTDSRSALTLDDVVAVMRSCEPPWAKYRGEYALHRSDYLPEDMPVALIQTEEFGKSVIVREETYQAMQRMDWGQFGPPKDHELAAMLAHAVLTRKKPAQLRGVFLNPGLYS